jgi:TolB-like protein/DNA-binding winged helix-turn-helix (wHTH) protein/Tfp pilus assembly protein PilF
MAPGGSELKFRIGEWTVFPTLNRIDREDVSVDLEPKLMDLLRGLAESAGEVVSKEDLLDRVWQVEHVADGTLSHAIAELRRALGDDARHPRYIETIRKRGYRLVADVGTNLPTEEPSPVEGSRTRRSMPWIVTAGLVIILASAAWVAVRHIGTRPSDPPRIVVLPFESLGGEANDSFAAGLTDEIISRLAAVRGLQVVSRTTAFNYESAGKTASEVGQDLDVEYILEGAVRWGLDRDPPTVRITPQLIRVDEDGHLWSIAFERHPEDILDVQSEIARQIVAQLDLRMARDESQVVEIPPTNDPVAYRAFVAALDRRESFDSQDLLTAAQMYRRAVEADPDFAQAWAGLAESNGAIHHFGYDRAPERCETAKDALVRARQLAPASPETLRALAFFEYHCLGDAIAARSSFHDVLAIWPGEAVAMRGMAYACRRTGRYDDAERWFRRALELDPYNAAVLWNLGGVLIDVHRYEEGLNPVQRAIELAPDLRFPRFAKCWALWLGWGDTGRVAEELERLPGPHDATWYEYAIRNACFSEDFQMASLLAEQAPPGHMSGLQRCLAATLANAPDAVESCLQAASSYRATCDRLPDSQWPRLLLARACSLAELHEEAVTVAAASVAMRTVEDDAPGRADAILVQAQVLGRSGRIEKAVALVEQLLDAPSGLSPARLRIDPELACLRGHPRIEEIILADAPPALHRIDEENGGHGSASFREPRGRSQLGSFPGRSVQGVGGGSTPN